MEENIDVILSLRDDESVSDLKRIVYEEELKEINNNHQLTKNSFDINATYFLKSENYLEVGFFIRNGLKQNLSLEEMMLVVKDDEGKNIASQSFNFKEFGPISSFSARPFELKFDLPEDAVFDETKKYIIKFGALKNVKGFSSVDTNLEDLPKNLSFEQEKAIKDFEKSLPTLKKGGFSISLYKLFYDNNRALNCILIFRNGVNSEAKLDRLPISVFDKDGNLIARAEFSNNEGLVKVSSNSSKAITFEFPPENVARGIHELENCSVTYE